MKNFESFHQMVAIAEEQYYLATIAQPHVPSFEAELVSRNVEVIFTEDKRVLLLIPERYPQELGSFDFDPNQYHVMDMSPKNIVTWGIGHSVDEDDNTYLHLVYRNTPVSMTGVTYVPVGSANSIEVLREEAFKKLSECTYLKNILPNIPLPVEDTDKYLRGYGIFGISKAYGELYQVGEVRFGWRTSRKRAGHLVIACYIAFASPTRKFKGFNGTLSTVGKFTMTEGFPALKEQA